MRNKNIVSAIAVLLLTTVSAANAADLTPAQNEKGKYGYVDTAGVFVVKPAYDMATPFEDGISRVRKGSKWGLMGENGELIAPVKYAFIGDYNKYGYAVVNVGGTSEATGIMIGTVTGGKYGHINKNGEEILPPKYTEIGFFDETNTAWVQAGNKYGLIDTTGMLIAPAKYVAHGTFGDNNICWVNVGGYKNAEGAVSGGKYGYLSRSGQEVIQPVYVNVRNKFHNGISWVSKGKGRYGYIDNTGKEIVAPIYDDLADTFSMNISYVKDRNLWGYITREGLPLTEIKYSSVFHFHGGMAAVGIIDGREEKFGYIDETGREVVPPIYESVAIYCNDNHGFVKSGGKWAYVDKNGTPLTPFNITGFSKIMQDGYVSVAFGPGFDANNPVYSNVLDSEGHLLNDKIYKNVWGLYGGYFCVNKSDGTWCWLDKQGNECFDGGYTTVGSFSEGLAFAGKNGKYIYIDTSGNKAFDVPNSGGELYGGMFDDGIAYIIKNDKQWGCIDKTGTVIVPYELDTQDDVAKLLSDRYSIKKEPLKRRDIELYNLYKNRTKCSIFDTLAEDMWGY